MHACVRKPAFFRVFTLFFEVFPLLLVFLARFPAHPSHPVLPIHTDFQRFRFCCFVGLLDCYKFETENETRSASRKGDASLEWAEEQN